MNHTQYMLLLNLNHTPIDFGTIGMGVSLDSSPIEESLTHASRAASKAHFRLNNVPW